MPAINNNSWPRPLLRDHLRQAKNSNPRHNAPRICAKRIAVTDLSSPVYPVLRIN